jgi:hypothetical protein
LDDLYTRRKGRGSEEGKDDGLRYLVDGRTMQAWLRCRGHNAWYQYSFAQLVADIVSTLLFQRQKHGTECF